MPRPYGCWEPLRTTMCDSHDRGEARDLHAGQDLIYNAGGADERKHQERYYKLIIIHIISLAITCMLLVINILKTDQTAEMVRDEKQDVIRYLNNAENNLVSQMNSHFRVMKQELQQPPRKSSETTTE